MQAIFRMGIPVTGKNIFPSNIQGLPTFYEVRVSKDGYTARPQYVDLVVALNPATYAKDVATVRPGGYLVYDSSWPLDKELEREGITIIGIPFGQMCVDTFVGDRDRTLLRNIVYAGALAALLEIDMDIVGQMLVEKFSKKKKLLEQPFEACGVPALEGRTLAGAMSVARMIVATIAAAKDALYILFQLPCRIIGTFRGYKECNRRHGCRAALKVRISTVQQRSPLRITRKFTLRSYSCGTFCITR
jgi:Pyruvate/2-oxoacid:ferredoxin oxidoreductase gamma subunit